MPITIFLGVAGAEKVNSKFLIFSNIDWREITYYGDDGHRVIYTLF